MRIITEWIKCSGCGQEISSKGFCSECQWNIDHNVILDRYEEGRREERERIIKILLGKNLSNHLIHIQLRKEEFLRLIKGAE